MNGCVASLPRRSLSQNSKTPLSKILYIGIDETNHLDRFNDELIVAAFSPFAKDIRRKKLHKQRELSPALNGIPNRRYSNPFQRLGYSRFYAFVQANRQDHFEKGTSFKAVVAASLLQKVDLNSFEGIHLLFDGSMAYPERKRVREKLSFYLKLPEPKIKIQSGRDLDEKMPLVNMADHLAYWLFRTNTLEELALNPNKRNFLE